MSLTKEIIAYKAGFVEKVPEDIRTIMLQATEDLRESGLIDQAPKVSEKLPSFILNNQVGKIINLSELLSQGPLVITFYRGGWCPYCNLELKAYQDVLADIKAAGGNLVAITPELPDNSLSTAEKNGLDFDVLTDVNSDYAREIGLVFTLPEIIRPIYESFGIQVEVHNGEGQFDLPLAATFVVDTNATIVSAFVDVDYTLRQEPAEVIKVLMSL